MLFQNGTSAFPPLPTSYGLESYAEESTHPHTIESLVATVQSLSWPSRVHSCGHTSLSQTQNLTQVSSVINDENLQRGIRCLGLCACGRCQSCLYVLYVPIDVGTHVCAHMCACVHMGGDQKTTSVSSSSAAHIFSLLRKGPSLD